jgi:FixJ family two-component response regulator
MPIGLASIGQISQSLWGNGGTPVPCSQFVVWIIRCQAAVHRMAVGGMMTKVLSVVEDDQSVRESMSRLLRSLGYTVEIFSSATEFLASPRLAETGCLIADIHMPAMTGLELYRHLIDSGHAIPTILVTAFPNDIDRARALKDGVLCYLRKPIDEEHLTQCVCAALRSGHPPEADS